MAESDGDVVTLLLKQHERILALFDEVTRYEGDARRDAFDRLVQTLTAHETAEEEIVHPYARQHLTNGEEIVEQRLAEEKQVKEALARLERMDPHEPDFMKQFEQLREDYLAHTQAEERDEFSCLQQITDDRERRGLAVGLKAAQSIAPTHPRPGVESGAKNAAIGPLAAIADRTRDAVRRAMQ